MEGVINFNTNKIVVSKCQMCLVLLVCTNAIRVSLKGEVQCLKEEVLEMKHHVLEKMSLINLANTST